LLSALAEVERTPKSGNASIPSFDFRSIKPGRLQAAQYHRTVFDALKYVFHPALISGVIEKDVDKGRKRIDIVFTNADEPGFFRRLQTQHGIFCPWVFIECKNYAYDPTNPEFDQLVGRFHDKRGRFGVLVCRGFHDQATKSARCGDIVGGGTGTIIVLEDADLLDLIKARKADDSAKIDEIMSAKLMEVFFNAR